jgi:CO dehydrogenase maturation factor
LKVAISGKGGVGKTSLAAALTLLLAERGERVLAVDADPDANLAAALGITAEQQRSIIPIAEQRALIEERTGAKVKQYGQIFKLNPDVSDIAAVCGYPMERICLLVLGAIEAGASGCACPESVMLRALITDLVLRKQETLICDMEAGLEHLGRATARGVDTLLVVVEPGQRSVDSAKRIRQLATDIGLRDVRFVANKITGPVDEEFVRQALGEVEWLGVVPQSEALRSGDRDGQSVLTACEPAARAAYEKILKQLIERDPAAHAKEA